MKILGIGNAIVDVICKVEDNFLSENNLTKSTMKLVDETEFKKLLSNLKIEETVSGGSVANSIVGLSQLGNKVGFIGKVNKDELGNKYEEGLKKENVEYFYYKKKEELPTGTCAFDKVIQNSNKVAMSLSDLFCVERHKPHFLDLVKNKLNITFANEQEILSLLDTKNFDEVVSFAKELKRLIVITRGKKGSITINKDEVVEYEIQKNLKIVDLTGAGDLFAAGFLHGYVNNLSIKESLQQGTEMSTRIIQKIGARL